MSSIDYNSLVLRHVEKNLDVILPATAVLSFLSAAIVYFSEIPRVFGHFDAFAALVFTALFILREKIEPSNKMMAVFIMGISIGAGAFADGGFDSAGLTIFMMCNVLGVLMMPKVFGRIISVVTFALFTLFGVLAITDVYVRPDEPSDAKWFIHIFMYLLFLIFLHASVYAIKDYLIEIIQALEENAKKTFQLAYYDKLTGLPNYDRLLEEVNHRIRQKGVTGHLVMFNIRNLRIINSVYGDVIGDKVLAMTASVLSSVVKNGDILARISGNEFVLWIEDTGERGIESELDGLKKNFYKNFHMEDLRKRIEFFNAYVPLDSNKDFATAYQQLITALTFAKKNNITSFVAYDIELEGKMIEDENLNELVKEAVSEDKFTLAYQPKVDIRSGKITGVEALSRWQGHDVGPKLPPSVFIPIIEELDLDVAFGEKVIQRAFEAYDRLQKKYGTGITLSINITPRQLSSPEFTTYVKEALYRSGIKAGAIIFEITEDTLIQGFDQVMADISELKAMGIRISLDDFGTGYSSLNYLMSLDIDELKIDRSFVGHMDDRKCQGMMEMIVKLTKEYDLDLVVEGVETGEQRDCLKEMGCYHIQGYLYGRPEIL